MKVRVKVTATSLKDHLALDELIDVDTAALRERDPIEIDMIVSGYVRDWLYRHLNVQWQFVDPNAFGLEFKPSEPRDS